MGPSLSNQLTKYRPQWVNHTITGSIRSLANNAWVTISVHNNNTTVHWSFGPIGVSQLPTSPIITTTGLNWSNTNNVTGPTVIHRVNSSVTIGHNTIPMGHWVRSVTGSVRVTVNGSIGSIPIGHWSTGSVSLGHQYQPHNWARLGLVNNWVCPLSVWVRLSACLGWAQGPSTVHH